MEITAEDIRTFIAGQDLGVLSTIGPDGAPQSALVGIAVSSELEIVFDTVTPSRKYGNLKGNPKCSFVVGCSGEVTVQYEGEAMEPEGDELARYREIYFAKMPDGRDRLSWPGITHFVVRPRWIRYCDYNQRPPLIREFDFEGSLARARCSATS